MQKTLFIVVFFLYLWILYYGTTIFGSFINPVLLLLTSLVLPFYILSFKNSFENQHEVIKNSNNIVLQLTPFVIGTLLVLLLIPYIGDAFALNPLPTNNSDVMPQLMTQYDRFINGEQPYARLEQFNYKPFPVYMPLHWLPLGIGHFLNIDLRWSGLILWLVPFIILLNFLSKHSRSYEVSIILPITVCMVFIVPLIKRREDINTIMETTVAAYYFLIAVALITRNLNIMLLGIIGALLSRYTIVFWLPLLLYVLYHINGKKVVYQMLIGISASVMLFYAVPFLMKDMSILKMGLEYHNGCGVGDWGHLDEGNTPWIFSEGTSFIQYFHKLYNLGSPQKSVALLRVIQLFTMIALNIFGIYYFKKNKDKIDAYHFLIAMAAIFIILFYATSPLVYGYYWFSATMLIWACLAVLLRRLV